MDEANEIDLVFRRYGGAFDYESVPYIGGLDALRDRLQSFSSSVMCAHINNPSFNAVAMLRGDKEYIGILPRCLCLPCYDGRSCRFPRNRNYVYGRCSGKY